MFRKTLLSRTRYIAPLLLLIFTGCTSLPAQAPPQLDDTPGPFVVVNEDTLQTASYWVDAPTHWKIVKSSIAADPIMIVFASPDDDMTITVSEVPLPELPLDTMLIQRDDDITLPNGQRVYVSGQAKRDVADAFDTIFSAVRDSIRVPQ